MRTPNECSGYIIIASIPIVGSDIEDQEICLGMKKIGEDKYDYATWEYNAVSHFYWGDYNLSRAAAYANMCERAAKCFRSMP